MLERNVPTWNSKKHNYFNAQTSVRMVEYDLEQEKTDLIRVSVGTTAVLGLATIKSDTEPTTAYIMTYREGKCVANCAFCPQARGSTSKAELLSRVTWPAFPRETVSAAIASAVDEGKIKRVCIQALNYPDVFSDLQVIVKEIKRHCNVPVSVACQPLNKENMIMLKASGVDRLGIALDAATEEVFIKVKGGCYTWKRHFELFEEALAVFGRGNVSTHVIVGLGESEKEAVDIIQMCVDLGVLPALFAFTPVRGTALEGNLAPNLDSYRRVQLARFLIVAGMAKAQDMSFDGEGKISDFGLPKKIIQGIIDGGSAFQTSGCPACNRPYYNEKPSGPIYNYPRMLNKEEIKKIKTELN